MSMADAVTAVSLLLACWGLYLTRLQVFPLKKPPNQFLRENVKIRRHGRAGLDVFTMDSL